MSNRRAQEVHIDRMDAGLFEIQAELDGWASITFLRTYQRSITVPHHLLSVIAIIFSIAIRAFLAIQFCSSSDNRSRTPVNSLT